MISLICSVRAALCLETVEDESGLLLRDPLVTRSYKNAAALARDCLFFACLLNLLEHSLPSIPYSSDRDSYTCLLLQLRHIIRSSGIFCIKR